MSLINSLGRALSQLTRQAPAVPEVRSAPPRRSRKAASAVSRPADPQTSTSRPPNSPPTASRRGVPHPATDYPGDFTGTPALSYQPDDDLEADPGEVVWTWVPYEEDHTKGKDRPVLIVGRADGWLLGLPLTSQDHDRDAQQEASEGRFWLDIGSGEWDSSGRASEVRVNRILRVDPTRIRRLAGRLGPERFDQVAAKVLEHSWVDREGS